MMQAFLRVADAKEDSDPELKEWVSQVRELAYDAEDVLDMFMLLFGHLRADGLLGCFKNVYATTKNFSARRDVALQLREMESRVNRMKDEHLRFQSKYEAYMKASTSHVVNHKFDGRDDARLVEENALLGMKGPKKELINTLLDGDSNLKALSVVGMGGLGKSTLVNRIYEDEQVMEKFQCHAWITVSQVYDIKELLKKLIRDLHVEVQEPLPQNVESLDGVVELKKFVKNFLCDKSYFIVLDDIWTIDSWDDLRYAFPNGNTCSRVLLTTRILDVANATIVEYCGYVYEMKALTSKDSWTLFCNKTFQDKICPRHLEDIGKRILAKCNGLPLAILAIGGMLALKHKEATSEWEMILNSFNSKLGGELERVKKVILLSYYDLPYYLNYCLLYFSSLREDWGVHPNTIIQLWIAEGLVQRTRNRMEEEVGRGYLNELIHRNLVHKKGISIEAQARSSCYIHDIVREVILSKSTKQNFLNTPSAMDSTLPSKVRRLAINSVVDNTFETSSLKHLRSFVLCGPRDLVSRQFINDMIAGNPKLLKVLHLERAPLEEIPNAVFKLYLLRHLNLRDTQVKVVPKAIGRLQHLETLNLIDTDVIELPIQILELKRLCTLFVFKTILRKDHLQDNYYIRPFRASYRIGCLSSLQSLMRITADQMGDTSTVKEIGRLTNLKRLGISKLRTEDGKDLCSTLEKLSHLQILSVTSIEEDEIIDLDYSLSSIPRLLEELCLEGRLRKVPQWIPFLLELKSLDLESSKLRNDPLEFLQDLPDLSCLFLTDAYEGTTLHFKAGKFPSLESLNIGHMSGLRSIVVEKDSMRKLIKLDIRNCKLMMEVPAGLEHLTKLQELNVKCMNEKFVAALENRKSDKELAHISMTIYRDDEHEWQFL